MLFPAVDFSVVSALSDSSFQMQTAYVGALIGLVHKQIETDEDTMWKADVRETKAEVAARGMKFMNWFVH